jgi:hypothetical protein
LIFFMPFVAVLLIWPASTGQLRGWHWPLDLAAGLALWTILEYLLHRFAFHYVPRSRRLRELQLHIAHHAHPTDPHTNVTPLSFSVPVTLLVWGGLALATGSWQHAAVMCAGAVLGYIAYELVHFSTHLSKLDGRLMRYWRGYHFSHHQHPRTCYGFTSPLWDIVFRTGKARSAARARGCGSSNGGHD